MGLGTKPMAVDQRAPITSSSVSAVSTFRAPTPGLCRASASRSPAEIKRNRTWTPPVSSVSRGYRPISRSSMRRSRRGTASCVRRQGPRAGSGDRARTVFDDSVIVEPVALGIGGGHESAMAEGGRRLSEYPWVLAQDGLVLFQSHRRAKHSGRALRQTAKWFRMFDALAMTRAFDSAK